MELVRCKSNPSILLLDELFNDFFDAKPMHQPTYDIVENDKEYVVNLSLPGFKKENINIDVDNDILKITAERKEDKDLKFNHKQTYYGNYYKQFKLTNEVNVDAIDASFVDGILNINIPKSADAKTIKKIEIK